MIVQSGSLIIGVENQPFLGNSKITLFGGKDSVGYPNFENVQAGNKILLNFGLVQFYGIPRLSVGKLLATVNKGDTIVKLSPGLNWVSGDKISLAPTNLRYK